jgi:hypothetical protein
MSQNIGTLISAPIRPNDSLDLIASAFANEIMGGHHGYSTLSQRDSLILARRDWGMLVTVYADGSNNGTYQLTYNYVDTNLSNNANWVLFSGGSGGTNNVEWYNPVITNTNIEPATASIGDRYLITSVATGAWFGNENKLAEWSSAATWSYTTPTNGGSVRVDTQKNSIYRYDGTYPSGTWAREILTEVRYISATGNGLTYSATSTTDIVSYTSDTIYVTNFLTTNTGLSASITINNIGQVLLKKNVGGVLTNLKPLDLVVGILYQIIYDGTYFQISIPSVATGNGLTYSNSIISVDYNQLSQSLAGSGLTSSGGQIIVTGLTAINSYLPLAGGTMSGYITLNTGINTPGDNPIISSTNSTLTLLYDNSLQQGYTYSTQLDLGDGYSGRLFNLHGSDLNNGADSGVYLDTIDGYLSLYYQFYPSLTHFTSINIGIDSIVATGLTTSFPGIQYAANYSANYTPLSLITYGDLLAFSASFITSSGTTSIFIGTTNGLSDYSGYVGLGGQMDQGTTIVFSTQSGVPGYDFTLQDVGYFLLQNNDVFDIESQFIIMDAGTGSFHQYGSDFTIVSNTDYFIGASSSIEMMSSNGSGQYVSLVLNNINNSTLFTDNRATASGIEYAADYSGNYTTHSLVTYGDLLAFSASTVSAGSGLSASGGQLNLGGVLTPVTTTIDANNKELVITGLSSSGTSEFSVDLNTGLFVSTGLIELLDLSVDGEVTIVAGDWSTIGNTYSIVDVDALDGISIGVDNGVTSSSYFNISASASLVGDGTYNNMIISDRIGYKGLVYEDDYSASFTTYSLITKGYLDSHASLVLVSNGLTANGATISIGGLLTNDTTLDGSSVYSFTYNNLYNYTINSIDVISLNTNYNGGYNNFISISNTLQLYVDDLVKNTSVILDPEVGVSISTLSGTQSPRLVEADNNGTITAKKLLLGAYNIPNTEALKLENISNWDINGNYIGATISGTYQGQKHYDDNYFYEAVGDNVFIRLIRG